MSLQEFKMSVCKELLLEGKKRGIPKRGRPSLFINTLHRTKKLRGPTTKSILGLEGTGPLKSMLILSKGLVALMSWAPISL